ncbi:MAG: hypothetical protein R3E86_10935 [Pseudomonadales bacterium]
MPANGARIWVRRISSSRRVTCASAAARRASPGRWRFRLKAALAQTQTAIVFDTRLIQRFAGFVEAGNPVLGGDTAQQVALGDGGAALDGPLDDAPGGFRLDGYRAFVPSPSCLAAPPAVSGLCVNDVRLHPGRRKVLRLGGALAIGLGDGGFRLRRFVVDPPESSQSPMSRQQPPL